MRSDGSFEPWLVQSSGSHRLWQTSLAAVALMYLPSTPAADAGRDGDADAAERKAIRAWIGGGAIAYDVRGDFRLDGDVDTTLANTSIIGGWNTAVSHGPISCGFPPSGPLMW